MTSATIALDDELRSSRKGLPEFGEAFNERLRARDPETLERFFELYFVPLHDRVRRVVRRAEEAEDLTQEIFLNIHRALPRFDSQKRLGPWVYSIAMNRVRDHWRSLRTVREAARVDGTAVLPLDSAPSDGPGFAVERKESDEKVKQAVDRLPLGMRRVLLMRIYDDLAFENIAKVLKLTTAAARKRYSRALKSLRGSLALEGARL